LNVSALDFEAAVRKIPLGSGSPITPQNWDI
jgi:hypothetical protein